MSNRFLERGYPPKLLNKIQSRLAPTVPTVLCTAKPTSSTSPHIPFIQKYHHYSTQVTQIIKKHCPLLTNSYPSITEFQTPPIMCHKRERNLRDHLMKADIGSTTKSLRQTTLTTKRMGTYPCLHCAQCSAITKGDTIHPKKSSQSKNFSPVTLAMWYTS